MRQTGPTSYELGYFDQIPGLSTYTVVLLGFPLPVGTSVDEVKQKLQVATDTLTGAFPWMRGKVLHNVPESEKATSSGTYSVSTKDANEVLRFKDVSNKLDTYQTMLKARVPMTSIPADVLSSQRGLPESVDFSKADAPVLVIDANFLKGGLILSFSSEHNVNDMNGQGQLIRLFAQAMRGEPYTKEQLNIGNVDRRAYVPLLRNGEKPLEFKHLVGPSKLGKNVWGDPVDAPWKVVRFSADRLKALKLKASNKAVERTAQGGISANSGWISTNDALTAFVWQRITAARAKRFEKGEIANLVRAINSRKRLSPQLADEYMGHMVFCTLTSLPAEEIMEEENLARVATAARQDLIEAGDHTIRAFIDQLAKEPDKSKFDYSIAMRWPKDIIFSSWAELRLSTTEFGSLGAPEFVRRPNMAPFESCCYIVEKSKEGDNIIALSIRKEDWAELKKDEVWKKYADMIG